MRIVLLSRLPSVNRSNPYPYPVENAILVLVITLAGRGVPHWNHADQHAHAEHVHSHGHWHGDEYHEHHHSHNQAVTESLEDHAQEPRDHGQINAPDYDSNSSTLIATSIRRHQWAPANTFVALVPICVRPQHAQQITGDATTTFACLAAAANGSIAVDRSPSVNP